ncbi:MAG: hypothetical protein QOE61_1550 [Micromonosporaceae bacterium]|jgi:catechol 2,3-dioxygenase-like lactoylglutathione lyase family enzyme|nr:hypothetical protein [Micromonosporaceae bacterium]
MLDHVFISVSDIDRSIDFYTAALEPLGITTRVDYASVLDPDGYSLEFTYKSWQH